MPRRSLELIPVSGQQAAPGDRWTICGLDHVHWGANGGAGLLLRRQRSGAEPFYLLTKRSRLVDEGGTWGIPGGAIRDGESPEPAARRETLEEIGRLPAYRVNGVEIQGCGGGWQFHLFVADVQEPFDAYSVHETDATGWFTTEMMHRLSLHSGLRRWLENRELRDGTGA